MNNDLIGMIDDIMKDYLEFPTFLVSESKRYMLDAETGDRTGFCYEEGATRSSFDGSNRGSFDGNDRGSFDSGDFGSNFRSTDGVVNSSHNGSNCGTVYSTHFGSNFGTVRSTHHGSQGS